jgi:hypothetical protein
MISNQPLNKAQYDETKAFMKSTELHEFLDTKFVGERFTFQCEKLLVGDVHIYVSPSAYPCSSHRKEG